jgi:hypothetical protein
VFLNDQGYSFNGQAPQEIAHQVQTLWQHIVQFQEKSMRKMWLWHF